MWKSIIVVFLESMAYIPEFMTTPSNSLPVQISLQEWYIGTSSYKDEKGYFSISLTTV
jgi:hypothetical protein